MKTKLHTIHEWNSKGYRVKKGSTAKKRSLGQSLFGYEQVYQIKKRTYGSYYSRDNAEYEYEGSWEETIGDPDFYH